MEHTYYKPKDPSLDQLFTLEIHNSIVKGFEGEFEKALIHVEPEEFEDWANSTINSQGQKANLARALSNLHRVGGGLQQVEFGTDLPLGFWDRVGRM